MKLNKRGGTTDEAYQKIKNMMYYNELVPGQKLIYQDLADRLNVSNTPIIQALKRLEYLNLVCYKPNKGYFVGEITAIEVKELYQAREALEVYLIPAIIKNLSSAKLKKIKNDSKVVHDDKDDRRLTILKDAKFHLSIAEIAENKTIYRILSGIFEEICLKYRPEYMGDERIREVICEHRELLDAINKRDVKEAIRATREHNNRGGRYVANSLSKIRPVFI